MTPDPPTDPDPGPEIDPDLDQETDSEPDQETDPDPDRDFGPESAAAVDTDLPEGVRVELAGTGDADALADLWVDLAGGQRRHGAHLHAEDNRRQVRETMLRHAASDTAYVARREGSKGDSDPGHGSATGADLDVSEVVGFVTVDLEAERFDQDVTRGIVYNIYVRSCERGDGIGSALLERAERDLAERGADVVALQALASNEAARRFYRRHGYTPHRVEMEKRLESDSLTTDG